MRYHGLLIRNTMTLLDLLLVRDFGKEGECQHLLSSTQTQKQGSQKDFKRCMQLAEAYLNISNTILIFRCKKQMSVQQYFKMFDRRMYICIWMLYTIHVICLYIICSSFLYEKNGVVYSQNFSTIYAHTHNTSTHLLSQIEEQQQITIPEIKITWLKSSFRYSLVIIFWVSHLFSQIKSNIFYSI